MSLLISTCALVFLRAFQQQNVIGRHYISAAVTSYAIAFAEVVVIIGIVKSGVDSALWVGTGGAVGVVCAMIAHQLIFKKWRAAKQNGGEN